MSRQRLSSTIIMASLLVGCGTVEERQSNVNQWLDGVANTLSGAYFSAKNYAVTTTANILFMKQDITNRVDKVQEGLDKLKEGKQLLDEGLNVINE